MKKFILAALASTLVATPALAAPGQWGRQNHGQQVRHTVVERNVYRSHTPQVRHWQRGQRFDARYARNYRQIDYRQYRGLRAPPRGYHYVRSGNDAVLVGITTGLIAAVLTGALN